MIWNQDLIKTAISVLKTSNSVAQACRDLSETWNELISTKALNCAFERYGHKNPTSYLDPKQERVYATKWSTKVLKGCIPVIRRHGTVPDACAELSKTMGREITATALRKAFIAAGMKAPAAYVDADMKQQYMSERAARASQGRNKKVFPPAVFATPAAIRAKGPVGPVDDQPDQSDQLGQKLLALVQRQTRTINELADQLDVSPKVIRQAIESLQHRGYGVTLERDQIVAFSALKHGEVEDANEISAQPGADGTYCFGAVSDTHFGSKYCDEDAFVRYVEYAYSLGVRHILHAGDIFTGLLNHHGMSYEVRILGFDNQVEDALRIMPQKPGLHYWAIIGNHEAGSWQKTIGMSPGAALVRRAQEMGRQDIHHVGDIQGRVVFGKDEQAIKVELAHPKASGNTYAISYPVQKWVERMPGGAKPHILISGHLHTFSVLDVRNVVCVQPGCFEHSTPYTREMGLHPAVGGVVIWARRDGLSLRFRSEWVATRTKPVDWTQIE